MADAQPSTAATASKGITIRAPTTSPPSWVSPPLSFLLGTWHVTHSTLPMWKKNKNVSITYSVLAPPSSPADPASSTDMAPVPRLNDHVAYSPINSDKQKSVTGIDTPAGEGTDVWDWRGKGWLMIASSHWEVIGYGEVSSEGGDGEKEEWAVTYFAKTLFTPAGVDVYSRRKEGLSRSTVEGIMDALRGVERQGLKELVDSMFVVKSDHYSS